ncbi:Trk system potassium transporter TrkA [Flavobacteriaceae bacterium F08102]|nr:Trk system potassium transporter TrkA [Flavobacteriaceae bacterium F08102]
MKIVIAGAGEVGFHLAKLLSYESHDITLIDLKKDRLLYADTRLDIKALKGNATSIAILKEANVHLSDLVIAVTSIEAINITISVLAKRLGAKHTISRISNSEFIDNKEEINFAEFGIDELISTEELATNEIKTMLNQAAFNHMHEFDNGVLSMYGMILSKWAPFVGMSVQQAAATFPEIHFMPIAIQTQSSEDVIIPRGNTVFKEGDLAYFITLDEGVTELYKLTGKIKKDVQNVMILGGGSIGRRTAKELCDKKMNIKIIERNKAIALELADELPNALVVYGDGRDVELLKEENIGEMDVFIGATESSETNIMTCLVAKSKKVNKTIALAENVDYSKLSHSIGIDTIINKKLLAANSIFRHIRKGDVVEIATLNNLNAEILEFSVRENSKITRHIIKDLHFPREATIGGVIRNGKGIIALGDFKIQAGDKVVISCLAHAVNKVEKFFD